MCALLLFTNGLVPLFREESVTAQSALQEDPLQQVMFLGVYLVCFALVLLRIEQVLEAVRRDGFLLALIAFVCLSCIWATDPVLSLRRAGAFLGSAAFGYYLVASFSRREILILLATALGVATGLSLIFVLLIPDLGIADTFDQRGWRGIYLHKNTLGRLMALAVPIFAIVGRVLPQLRVMWWVLAGCAGVLLVFSLSRTSLIVLVVLLPVLTTFRILRWHYTLLVPAIVGVLVIGSLATSWVVGNAERLAATLDRDITLTGRTDLWEAVFAQIERSPWIGYGYSGFWLGYEGPSAAVWRANRWHPVHAHNGLLDVFVELGLVGLVIFLFVLGRALLRSATLVRSSRAPDAIWPLAYLTFVLLSNMTEAAILRQNSIFWVMFVVACISAKTQATDVPAPRVPVLARS